MAKFGVENSYGGVDLQKTVEILWNKVMGEDVPEPTVEDQEQATVPVETSEVETHTEG
jgi:hypothetical protein